MKWTYTKLKDGNWGLRCDEPGAHHNGKTVEVTTKAGATKKERVGKQLWSGEDRDGNPVGLYSIWKPEAPASAFADDDDDGGDFS